MTNAERLTASDAVPPAAASSISHEIARRTSILGEQARGISSDVRDVARRLRDLPLTGGVATLAETGAERIDAVGRYLCDADGESLAGDLATFTREHPVLASASAFVAGLVAVRLLRISSPKRGDGSLFGAR